MGRRSLTLQDRSYAIIGAGALARQLASRILCRQADARIAFYADSHYARKSDNRPDTRVLTLRSLKTFAHSLFFAVGYSEPKKKLKLIDKLIRSGIPTRNYFVDQEDRQELDERFGQGNLLFSSRSVDPTARVESFNYMGVNSCISEGVEIGSGNYISPAAVLLGGVKIRNGVFVGAGAIITEGVTVGDRSFIQAGALVIRDVPNDVTVYESRHQIFSKQKMGGRV